MHAGTLQCLLHIKYFHNENQHHAKLDQYVH